MHLLDFYYYYVLLTGRVFYLTIPLDVLLLVGNMKYLDKERQKEGFFESRNLMLTGQPPCETITMPLTVRFDSIRFDVVPLDTVQNKTRKNKDI